MKIEAKFKRILAKEILFFFTAIGIVVLIWGFLFLRNTYFVIKAKSCSEKVISLQIQLDTLPKDYVSEFYNLTSRYYVVNYKIADDTFAIPKEKEKEFLSDNINIQKNIALIPNYPKGYSYFKFNYVAVRPETTISFSSKEDLGKQVKKQYPQYADIDDIKLANKILEKFTQRTDSTIVFDFVSIDKFRDFVSSEDYQEKLYTVFANNSDKGDWIPPEVLRAKFDPMKPYNGVFELGTPSEFKAKLSKSLKYNQTIDEEKEKIETEIKSQQDLVSRSKNSLLPTDDIYGILFITLIVIGILLYPVRLSALIILWAVKTMKQKA